MRFLGLELGLKEESRRVAFYWIGGKTKSALGLWEKPPWVSETNARDLIVTQHFAFEVDLADLGRMVATMKQRGIKLRNFFGETTDVPPMNWTESPVQITDKKAVVLHQGTSTIGGHRGTHWARLTNRPLRQEERSSRAANDQRR